MKTAMISGAFGQDASYLAELLLEKGYKVVSFARRIGIRDDSNIRHLFGNPNFIIESGDVTDFGSLARLIQQYKPDKYFSLAAQSFVAASWTEPVVTEATNFNGVGNSLEAIRLFSPSTKFYNAATSERWGQVKVGDILDENYPANPRSPYAASKYASEQLVKVYRDSYKIFAASGILMNHDSKRRGKEFLTRKCTSWIGENFNIIEREIVPNLSSGFLSVQDAFNLAVDKKIIEPLRVGNLDPMRDISHSADMVKAMYLILEHSEPEDFVICSEKAISMRTFIDMAFAEIGVSDWSKLVVVDPKFYRPADVQYLCGSSKKAREKLGWKPEISLESLIKEMVQNDISINRK